MGQFATAAQQRVEDTRCKLGIIVSDFDDDDVAELVRLGLQNKPGVIIELIGGTAKEKTVRGHLRGRCTCPDDTPGKGVVHG